MLDRIFSPKSVAIVGASEGDSVTGSPKMGTAAIAHLIKHGFAGDIYPVNPRHNSVAGHKCYPSVEDIPEEVDLALVLVPAKHTIPVMRQCANKGVKAAIVFSSGFSDAGESKLESQLKSICTDAGIRFCGPNSAGIIGNLHSFVACISMVCQIETFKKGDIAFLTQSGALGGSMLGRGLEEGVGFSHWAATGNETDIQLHEYMNYVIELEEVRVLALFIEGIRDGFAFVEACKKAAKAGKPIVVYKTGLSDVAAKTVTSHTGAIAGSNKVFDAVCKQFGVVRVDDAADLLPVARAFSWSAGKYPAGPKVGIISASGGICGVAADDCYRFGLEIPELKEDARASLRNVLPEFASTANPIDVTGQIRSYKSGYQDTVREVLAQDNIDGVLLLVTMVAEPRATFYGVEISKLAKGAKKPIIVGWTGAVTLSKDGYRMLLDNKVPTFLSSHDAVKTFSYLLRYAKFRESFISAQAQ